MPKHKRPYIAYYRVSTAKQGKKGLGISAQKTAVKKFLKEKKREFPPEHSFTEIESGKKTHNRPRLIKALDLTYDLKGILIVAKLDRLSRDLHFITSIEKAKIDFVCCDYPNMDKLQLHIMGSLAEWEREQISKRTKLALAELKKKGKKLGWHNAKVKRGLKAYWKKNKKPAVIGRPKKKKPTPKVFVSKAEQYANSLRTTFTLIIEKGLTLEQMAKELGRLKVKTRQGHDTWDIKQVVRLLKRLELTKLRAKKLKAKRLEATGSFWGF